MSTVKRCDRCHTECDGLATRLELWEYNRGTCFREITTYDLCDDCVNDLHAFMESGVKHKEPTEKKFKWFKRKD